MADAERAIAKLTDREAASKDDAMKARCKQLLAGKPGDPGLQGLARVLGGLLNAVESADRMPPSQVIAVYQETLQKLTPRLEEARKITGAAGPPL
jgi:hypothetical protein